MHLYEMTTQMQGLMALIDEGEMDQETLADTLEGLEGIIQEKGAGMLYVLANLSAQAAAFDREIKRMQARKKTLVNNHEWLKEYLRTNMVACGITEISSDHFTAKVGTPGKVVDIENVDLIPEEYLKHTPETWAPIKAEIAKALKKDIEVPGCVLVDGKAPLRIT